MTLPIFSMPIQRYDRPQLISEIIISDKDKQTVYKLSVRPTGDQFKSSDKDKHFVSVEIKAKRGNLQFEFDTCFVVEILREISKEIETDIQGFAKELCFVDWAKSGIDLVCEMEETFSAIGGGHRDPVYGPW